MNCTAGKFAGVVFWTFCAGFIFLALEKAAVAQSSDIEFPTAITENQVNGAIKARDIGDPRVTTFYYTFNGLQGDLFINVVTKNLSGSVDVFLLDGMRPLSNILVYADVAQSETGRVIYLRKPDKLILRVQGRTPNDDPAEFQIKFAGGFEAATPTKDETPVPKVPEGDNKNGIKVNSVGTIVALPPKPKATPRANPTAIAKVDEKREKSEPVEEKPNTVTSVETKTEDKTVETGGTKNAEPEIKESAAVESKAVPVKRTRTPRPKPTRSKANQTTAQISQAEKTAAAPENSDNKSEPTAPASQSKPEIVITDTTAKTDAEPTVKQPDKVTVNPLANVRLVILFKDGTKIERPMTEVFRFTADQSTLTVIGTNGRISKFPILDVSSVTIQ